jgi:PmbA protein
MSGIQVDLLSDYIGGEVRLGYYFDGTKVKSETGISISGSQSNVLKNMYLSNEEEKHGRYSGPKLTLFKGFSIQ